MKIGLGTVQFGSHYGISNTAGAPSLEEIKKIINTAHRNGIRLIDTASTYVSSEELLGNAIDADYGMKIVTKTPVSKSNFITVKDINILENALMNSLARLQQNKIYALLVHHCDELFKKNGNLIYEKMCEFKKAGLVEKLGVSLYTAGQIEMVLNHFPVDIVQLPLNVLDQRLINNGHLSVLKNKEVEIHARSVFLQGLLLMVPDELHSFFNPIKVHLKQYHDFIANKGLSPVEAALLFVLNVEEVDCIIVGVNSALELEEILSVEKGSCEDFSRFSILDEKFLNPSKWDL